MKESDYKNPKWQRKRLEVMQAKGFKCEWCESKEKELHVHHLYYQKNREIWEYMNSQFMLLCKDCHENFHRLVDLLSIVLSIIDKKERIKLFKFAFEMIDSPFPEDIEDI